jgi:hypothetical protein
MLPPSPLTDPDVQISLPVLHGRASLTDGVADPIPDSPGATAMNSRRRIRHPPSHFIDSPSRPRMHWNGALQRLPLGLFAAVHESLVGLLQ